MVISDGRQDVIGFQKGVIRQNLLVTRAVTQEVKNIRETHAFTANAGPSAAFARLHRNSLQQFHKSRILHHQPRNKSKGRSWTAGRASGRFNSEDAILLFCFCSIRFFTSVGFFGGRNREIRPIFPWSVFICPTDVIELGRHEKSHYGKCRNTQPPLAGEFYD